MSAISKELARAMDVIKRNIEVLKDNKVPVIFVAKPTKTIIEGIRNCIDVLKRNAQEVLICITVLQFVYRL